jgi:hypothetical protein
MMKPLYRKNAERWLKAEYDANYKGKVHTPGGAGGGCGAGSGGGAGGGAGDGSGAGDSGGAAAVAAASGHVKRHKDGLFGGPLRGSHARPGQVGRARAHARGRLAARGRARRVPQAAANRQHWRVGCLGSSGGRTTRSASPTSREWHDSTWAARLHRRRSSASSQWSASPSRRSASVRVHRHSRASPSQRSTCRARRRRIGGASCSLQLAGCYFA